MECWGDEDTLISAIKRNIAKESKGIGMLIHVGWPRKEGLSEEVPFEPRPACHFLGGTPGGGRAKSEAGRIKHGCANKTRHAASS